ncbi:TPM domain-containing protein [Lacticaseibacillus parahuelsenbergensis]|uniref:TPM domain-containing protein n=1 Tax=Lacticaseibacillus parahuelsenbergensis TaxID=3068305 RepID=A0ABY9L127_9LACO|nr:TPM domain-containing protein [Lacticaseibacillus sp. NCIMB 15471]WLV77365.1 TPM domain-containing protein [Lacticaseibacillus sp. NCIMB 15471]
MKDDNKKRKLTYAERAKHRKRMAYSVQKKIVYSERVNNVRKDFDITRFIVGLIVCAVCLFSFISYIKRNDAKSRADSQIKVSQFDQTQIASLDKEESAWHEQFLETHASFQARMSSSQAGTVSSQTEAASSQTEANSSQAGTDSSQVSASSSQEDTSSYDEATDSVDSLHPTLGRFYYDYAGILDQTTKHQVQAANPLNSDKSPIKGNPQIVLMTIPTTNDESIAYWTDELLDRSEWKIGDADKDNGVFLLFAQNNGKNNVRISTGYGVEDVLPDAMALDILNTYRSDLKSHNQARINRGLRAVLSDVKAVITTEYHTRKKGTSGMNPILKNVLMILLVLMMPLDWFILAPRRRQYSEQEAVRNLILVQGLMLLDLLSAMAIVLYKIFFKSSGSSGSGGFFDSGSSSGGDFSGGGFSDGGGSSFGGGDFGGGGADI